MKKIILSLLSVLVFTSVIHAQKHIDVYNGNNIIGSLISSDIDSVRITGNDASSRQIHFYSAGQKKTFMVSDIDSIKVNHSDDTPYVYLGIAGFNQELYDMPIGILTTRASDRYSSFVRNLMRKDGTLLYYGVEHALDMLSQYDFTTPLTSVNLITFTDGLDQGSLMMNSGYLMESDYLDALNQRIHSSNVRGLPITAYSLGLRGNDVSDYNQFKANLLQLASSEDKAFEVNSIYDVRERLQIIADQIISVSNRQNVKLKIPGTSNGTRIRFIFDGSSPEYSGLYIDGVFNLADRSLCDVTYHGLRSTSGTIVRGEQNGIFVTFTFDNLQRLDNNGLVPTEYIRQYNQAPSSFTWQINSEFTPENNTQTSIAHSGAAIILVLDCSNSLGYQFSNMQEYACDFINRVAQNAGDYPFVPTEGTGNGTLEDPYNSVAAYNIASALASGAKTSEAYYIKGKVVSVKEQFSAQYGNASFYISDDGTSTDQFYVFRALYFGNQNWTSGNAQIKVGDEVVVYAKLTNYQGNTPETAQGDCYVYSINGKTEDDGSGGDTPNPGTGGSTLADFTNGDFESWTDGQPDGWQSKSSVSNATLLQSTDAHSGSYSVKVGGATSGNKRMAYKEMELEAGTYAVTFYAKAATADGGSVNPGYVPMKADGTVGSYVYGGYVNDLNTNEWTKVDYEFTLGDKTTVCLVIMNSKNPGKDVLIDDFTITKN